MYEGWGQANAKLNGAGSESASSGDLTITTNQTPASLLASHQGEAPSGRWKAPETEPLGESGTRPNKTEPGPEPVQTLV